MPFTLYCHLALIPSFRSPGVLRAGSTPQLHLFGSPFRCRHEPQLQTWEVFPVYIATSILSLLSPYPICLHPCPGRSLSHLCPVPVLFLSQLCPSFTVTLPCLLCYLLLPFPLYLVDHGETLVVPVTFLWVGPCNLGAGSQIDPSEGQVGQGDLVSPDTPRWGVGGSPGYRGSSEGDPPPPTIPGSHVHPTSSLPGETQR